MADDRRALNSMKRKFFAHMVPGAGLEPARTLPGPRDFKIRYPITGRFPQNLITGKTTVSIARVSPCPLLRFDAPGTIDGHSVATAAQNLLKQQRFLEHHGIGNP